MYPPGRGIWWPRVVLHQVSLTFTVRCKICLTFTVRYAKVRCTPHRGIWWPRVVLCHVSLTFTVRYKVSWTCTGQMYPPASRSIWWPRVVLHQVSLTFTVRCKVSLTFTVRHAQVRCTPSRGIWWQDWYKSMVSSNGFSASFHVHLLKR